MQKRRKNSSRKVRKAAAGWNGAAAALSFQMNEAPAAQSFRVFWDLCEAFKVNFVSVSFGSLSGSSNSRFHLFMFPVLVQDSELALCAALSWMAAFMKLRKRKKRNLENKINEFNKFRRRRQVTRLRLVTVHLSGGFKSSDCRGSDPSGWKFTV